jgi:hypothetical protein
MGDSPIDGLFKRENAAFDCQAGILGRPLGVVEPAGRTGGVGNKQFWTMDRFSLQELVGEINRIAG